MSIESILLQINAEIERLQQVRSLLAASSNIKLPASAPGKRGPKPGVKRAKRNLSPEARARIAEAQRRRWAAQKKKSK
jgi:hypothetical protein